MVNSIAKGLFLGIGAFLLLIGKYTASEAKYYVIVFLLARTK